MFAGRFEPLRRELPADGESGDGRQSDLEVERGVGQGDGPWFVCVACRARVAPRAAIFAVDGETDHVRHNPHGLVFHIRCLRRAPGARAVGIATADHTWFAGYGWRIALCDGCGVHLGWGFEGPDRFWGLIAERLVEAAE